MPEPSKFSFGTASSGASAGGIFGSAGANSGQSKPLFGAVPTSSSSGSSGSLFGSTTPAAPSSASPFAAPATSSGGSLFSAPKASSDAQTKPVFGAAPGGASNLFGGGGGGGGGEKKTSGFSFGTPAAPPAATATPTSSNLFGGGSSTVQSTTAAITAPTGGFSFGTNTTTAATPATTQPSSSGAGSLFGGGTTPAAKPPVSNLFGAAQASSKPSDTSTPQANKTSSLFSTTPAGNPPVSTSLFGQQAQQKPSGASSLFGAPANKESQPAATSNSSNLFSGAQKSGQTTNGATTPTAPSLFGAVAITAAAPAPASTTSTQPATSTLFGKPAAAPATSSATTSSASAAPLFGQNMSSAPAASSTPQTGTTSSAAAPSLFSGGGGSGAGGLFGQKPATTSTAQPASTTTATTTPAGSTLFGASTATAGSNQPAATTTAAAGISTGAAASTTGTAPPAQSRLAGKTMDEILTSWSTSLASHQKTFQSLSKQISTWDRALVENSGKISALYGKCFQAERDCSEVERQLSVVENSQRELEVLLDRYEMDVERLRDTAGLGDGSASIGGVDAERERTYKSAEASSARLSDMSHSLTSMIEEINEASTKLSSTTKTSSSGDGDPLSQIVRVLNGHLAQLQTINNGAETLGAKVAAAQRDAKVLGENQGLNGGGRWVDDFGRSYLGRN
ncbi:Hypothetical protein R9X50_00615200 [Acrodontium crateriforme]|uniref:Nucleoporin NSP1 n=1 Tax=Acrodontium crateriforme TaxID=150365 RepID=A0AAQ3M978_9PEZI|nr:Hypothetical protein R9X50_00615200 [Acrodontium crateriforme]